MAGQVAGDLTADDRVTLRDSARVQGDITSSAIELEEGCFFRGEVDMGAGHRRPSRADAGSSPSPGRSRSASPNGDGSLEPRTDDEAEAAELA